MVSLGHVLFTVYITFTVVSIRTLLLLKIWIELNHMKRFFNKNRFSKPNLSIRRKCSGALLSLSDFTEVSKKFFFKSYRSVTINFPLDSIGSRKRNEFGFGSISLWIIFSNSENWALFSIDDIYIRIFLSKPKKILYNNTGPGNPPIPYINDLCCPVGSVFY